MLTPAQIRTRLIAASPDALRAWLSGGHPSFALNVKIEHAREIVTAEDATEWSLDRALEWMQDAANGLVGTTHFEQGKMVKDDTGASGSTFAPLQNYAVMGVDAPLAVHADALELLRIHSHKQLSRAEFEKAYDAVKAAMDAEGLTMPREGDRPYIGNAERADKLRGGGRYVLDRKAKQIVVEVGYNKGLVDAMRAGALRGIARYRDPGRKDFSLVIDPTRTEDFAAVVRKHGFAELADAFDQLGGYWEKTLTGGSAERRREERERAQAAAPTATADAGAVPAEGTRWRWDPDAFRVRLYTPGRAIDVARQIGNGATFASDAAAGPDDKYFVAFPTRAELIGPALDALAVNFPRTAEAMRPFVSTWTATRSALKQSREGGRTEEGSWELVERKKRTTKGVVTQEYVRVYTMYLKDPETGETIRWWRSVPGSDAAKHDGKRFSVEVPVKRVGKLVDVLRRYFPRLAEAISRAYGGVAGAIDEEAEACAALLDLSDKLTPEGATNDDAIEALDQVRRAFAARVPAGLAPLPFQTVGIAFAKLTDYRALIGDAPGLGKTIQGLGCLITDPEMLLPAVIVAPKNVTVNWMREAAKWMPTVPRVLISTNDDEIPTRGWKGISVMSWEMLVAHADEIIDAGTACVIADEAHYAKNPGAQRTKSLVAVLEKVPHGILLTGTPIKNVVVELHTLLSALDPETWGTRKAFAEAYVAEQKRTPGGGTQYIGVKDVGPLQKRLACSMVRRQKEDALKDLPKKERVYYQVPMTAAQRDAYMDAEENFLSWYEEAVEDRVRAELAREGVDDRTASAQARASAQAKAEAALRAQAIVKMGELRRIVGGIKTQPAIDLARRLVAEGENVVIFAAHKPVIKGITKALEATGIPYGVIDGEASAQARGQATEDFQAGKLRVIVASEAGKEGLTLTRAANTIFVERFWTPADEQQAEDRIHRIGQTRPVTITYLHVPDTIDDRMHEIIETKRALVDRIIGDDEIEEQDRDETQADFIRFLVRGERGAPPPLPAMRPIAEAGGALTARVKQNPTRGGSVRKGDVQSLMFDKRAWTRKTAAHWLRVNGYRVSDPVETAHYLTYEQKRADAFRVGTFRTVNVLSSVRALIGQSR